MALDIRLFIHGVPKGQEIWGPKGEEQGYLSSFYGPKWTTPEVMKVDIKTFGGVAYCYYTFVKGKNVLGVEGRPGSYFAITLRANAFYCDVQNIYNILKAAYDKMFVGLCINEVDSAIKYIVSDFQSIDSKLNAIENHILSYISNFSVNNDVLNLSGFDSISTAVSPNINLLECSKRIAVDHMRKYGKFSVSSFFLSASAAKTVEKCKAETAAAKEAAKQEIQQQKLATEHEITIIKKETESKITAVKNKAEEDLRASKEEIAHATAANECRIAELREKCITLEEKSKQIELDNKDLVKKISKLEKACKNKDKAINKYQIEIQKIKSQGQQAGGKDKGASHSQTKQTTNTTQGTNSKQHSTQPNLELGELGNNDCHQGHKERIKRIFSSKKILLAIMIVVAILLLAMFVFTRIFSSTVSIGDSKPHNTKIVKGQVQRPRQSKQEQSLDISITQSGKPVSTIECGKSDYNIKLIGNNAESQEGEWFMPAFEELGSGYIRAKCDSAGKTCIIAYKANGKIIAKKSVKIIRADR